MVSDDDIEWLSADEALSAIVFSCISAWFVAFLAGPCQLILICRSGESGESFSGISYPQTVQVTLLLGFYNKPFLWLTWVFYLSSASTEDPFTSLSDSYISSVSESRLNDTELESSFSSKITVDFFGLYCYKIELLKSPVRPDLLLGE